MPELSKSQVIAKVGYAPDVAPLSSYAKIRQMRKDPTISLVRLMFFAGIIAADWSVETEEDQYDEAVEYIKDQLISSRRHILSTAALGCFDFGWQPFEKVFEVKDGTFSLKKLKSLLQDLTEIKTNEDTGAFEGFIQSDVEIPVEKSLLFNFDVEGTNWTGNSIMSNIESPYDSTMALHSAAKRFDEKMAGAHWVVYYPDGVSTFKDVETPNSEIADHILTTLRASGSIAVPIGKNIFDEVATEKNGWRIELITASGASFPFGDRFDYLDKLKVRGAGFPERSILEGTFGTKAEAEAHGDFVITMIEYRHSCLVETVNWHLVNQMLKFQFGSSFENKVYIKQAPLNDAKRFMLSQLYDKILSNPDGFVREIEVMDVEAIADSLGIPRIEEQDNVVQPIIPKDIPAGLPS